MTDPLPTHEDEPSRDFRTDSGIELKQPYLGPQDRTEAREAPGEFPFTRALTRDLYREHLWERDIYAGFGNVEDAKSRYEELLDLGASGINIALDLPTQVGLDSDDPEAAGEVGRVGLALDSLADLEDLFRGIDLRRVRTIFTVGNGIGPIAAALFSKAAEKQGVPEEDFVIHLQNDPLKEFTGRGAFVFPLMPSIRLAADVVEYATRRRLFHWKPIGICGSQYRWGGGSAITEIAYGIAGARLYVDELLSRGLDIDDFGRLLEMHLAADIELFEEVAKFRAARGIWADMMKQRGATVPEAMQLRVSLYTAGYRLTKQQPLNNSVRVTLQALAAVLGGVQHVGNLSFDEALSTPSRAAARLAVATHQILAYEAKIGDVVDPLGGSYFVEWLTDELDQRIRREMNRVDTDFGGMLEAIRKGEVQRVVQQHAYEFQKGVETGHRVVVGVNAFVSEDSDDKEIQPFVIDESSEKRQKERLASLRAKRNAGAVRRALVDLKKAAEDDSCNLVEPIKEAVGVYATVGEICGALREVFGDWRAEGMAI